MAGTWVNVHVAVRAGSVSERYSLTAVEKTSNEKAAKIKKKKEVK